MHGYVPRLAAEEIRHALERAPVVVLLGPRQCGKSTLAKRLLSEFGRSVYLDLQARADHNKLREPELFLEQHRDALVCLDEIQHLPNFFSILRSEVDRERRPGRFLLLGSASRDLIRQSSETLAGRVAYVDLTPFLLSEVEDHAQATWQQLWVRGGFPESLLAATEEGSRAWRRDFVRTFLERDIPQLGFAIPVPVMERLWRLLAHHHGQTVNYSKLAASADLSVPTLKRYLHLLEQTYMLRLLPPYAANSKKRLVKSPKVYLRDTGLLHTLLDVDDYDQLLAQPINCSSWEAFGIENIIAMLPHHRPSFLRTSNGAEVDLVMERGTDLQLFEFKLSKAPKPSRGFFELQRDLRPAAATIIAPVDEPYWYAEGLQVAPLRALTH